MNDAEEGLPRNDDARSDAPPPQPAPPAHDPSDIRYVEEPQLPPVPPPPRREAKRPATPALQIQIVIPNGMVGKPYRGPVAASVHRSSELPVGYRPEDVTILPQSVEGLDGLGLRFVAEADGLWIDGRPEAAGDHPIVVRFDVLLRGKSWTSAEKRIVLTINPDPRSLWKEVDPDPADPFPRAHTRRQRIADDGGPVVVAASRRGRSHANKGEHRDDDFRLERSKSKGWYAIALADGAGSAAVSRQGATLACGRSIDFLAGRLESTLGESFETALRERRTADPAIDDALLHSLGEAGRYASREIARAARESGRPVEHFATTLILAIAKRFDFGWFVAAIAVGDGGVAALGADGTVAILNRPDSGEFAGQTRFATMPQIWTEESEVRDRIRFAVLPDLVALIAMTDGVSDPKFPTERDFHDPAKWRGLWKELTEEVGVHRRDAEADARLLAWLEFWSVGSHDDRTIAILLPCPPIETSPMKDIITIKATDGSTVQFVDEIIGSGGMKDVYFSPDRSYVVALFRDAQNATARDRLETIVARYRTQIFDDVGGDYWKDLFCWPTKIVEVKGKLGLVAPTYKPEFFFKHGSRNEDFLGIKGREKQGKWFASAHNRSKFLDPRELGNWRSYLSICIKISRAVHRMHATGLAHSDLSYRNVLVDPAGGNACIIDIDGLVVPGKFPPDVIGTADFIAPEVVATSKLPKGDPGRKLPRIETDRHALSVLIYMYLLYRHPLNGGKIHDPDPTTDEEIAKGRGALFVEHPTDASNRPNIKSAKPSELPWLDVAKRPYSLAGPYLKELFDQAFVEGLHDPSRRPSANDWLHALVKTVDLIQPCSNPVCEQKWYVFDNSTKPACPFCGSRYVGELPILNLYSTRGKGAYRPDNHRLMVYSDQYLYLWHVDRNVFPSERLTAEQKKPVGYFKLHEGR